MSVLSDFTITDLCQANRFDMRRVGGSELISPFEDSSIKREERDGKMVDIISYGLSSYGYDCRLASALEIFTNINNAVVDPKRPPENCRVKAEILKDNYGADFAWLPPHSFMLGHTVEYFKIPRNCLVICLGKSTYARAGIIVNVTPLEPEWEGNVVIEISNTTQLPQKIYVNEGIAQFIFLSGDQACKTSYKDRGGKYQGQTGITIGRV